MIEQTNDVSDLKITLNGCLKQRVNSKIDDMNDATHVCCDFITKVDDKDMDRAFFRLIAFRLGENGYVPVWIGIFSEEGILGIAASIDRFEQKTGLYSFALDQVDGGGDYFPPSHMAAQVHSRIRDIYHTHTWTSPDNDIGMLPIIADRKESAIEGIWNEFFCKTMGVEEKRNAKMALIEAEEEKTSAVLKSMLIRQGRKDLHRIAREWASKGMGDCLYAKSFIDKFFRAEPDQSDRLNGQRNDRLNFINRLQECYAMLERNANADMQCRRIPLISVYAVLLAVMMLAIPFSSIGHQFIEKFPPILSDIGYGWIFIGYASAMLVLLIVLYAMYRYARRATYCLIDKYNTYAEKNIMG